VVDVDLTAPGRKVPDDFLGVSVEWDNVSEYLGDGAGKARGSVVTLLGAFAAEGHLPVVRIGGNSEDQSWWNPTGLPKPAGVLHDIVPEDLATLADLQAALGNQLVLGLNFGLDDANGAAALVAAARAAIPDAGILAFELGNEPDSYPAEGHRADGYDWATYYPEVTQFRDAIAAQLTGSLPF
jgi:hypothetical protein